MWYKLLVTALATALVAVNGVLHFLSDPVIASLLGLLTSLGLYLLPSPAQQDRQRDDRDDQGGGGSPTILPF
jgi:hypothetical protein